MSSANPVTKNAITGSCACGKVTFATDDEPGNVYYCYCTTCRKISGAEYIPWVHFARKEQIRWNRELDEFSKSARARRTHCANCGASLTMTYHKDPHDTYISLGSFDQGLERVKPVVKLIYVKEKVAWAVLPAGVPQAEEE